jgi:predicted transcriptional regulator
MNKQMFKDVMQRVEAWPDADKAELLEYALEIEARREEGPYHATPEELAGIDRGLRDAAEGRFATDEEVKAVFARFRRGP